MSGGSGVKIGAGKATNELYKTVSGLNNPYFIGKAMFIYVDAKNLGHLNSCLIPLRSSENFKFDDPMDQIPIT